MENKIFENVRGARVDYSNFDLSFEHKFSCNEGQLIPFYNQDILPGDMFSLNAEILLRFAPMLAPVMHRINVFTHFWFVPNRLVWGSWEDFITGGDDGTAAPTFPVLTGSGTGNFAKGDVPDYLGIPISQGAMVTDYDFISQLPFRAYHLIWSEFYRDQLLQTEYDPLTDANVDATLCTIRLRAWEKDYFTSCLPAAQKITAPTIAVTHSTNTPNYLTVTSVEGTAAAASVDKVAGNPGDAQVSGTDVQIKNLNATTAINLTSTISINDLRLASRLQEFWERRSRGGSRYTEFIQSEFGVKSSDSRLQRPEYLGGGKSPVVISEVLQQTAPSTGYPQGNMAGHGVSVGGENKFAYRAEEYGWIIGMFSVMPRSAYQEGIDVRFTKTDKFDFGLPAFAHLGEQIVKNREIYFDNSTGADDPTGTFGYQQKYAEYKYNKSLISGDFRDDLSYWTQARIFGAEPSLNEDFIQMDFDDESMSRIFSSEEAATHKIWVQAYFDVKAKRPLPYFGDPRLT